MGNQARLAWWNSLRFDLDGVDDHITLPINTEAP